MAFTESTVAVNMIAGEDMRTDTPVGSILTVEDDSDVGKVVKATAVTDTVVGYLSESPDSATDTDGQNVPMGILTGKVPLVAGDDITAGELIVPDTTAGRVASVANVGALAVDSMAIGVALESAVDGDVFSVLAMPIAAPHTA